MHRGNLICLIEWNPRCQNLHMCYSYAPDGTSHGAKFRSECVDWRPEVLMMLPWLCEKGLGKNLTRRT
jgi:hypothetical protein